MSIMEKNNYSNCPLKKRPIYVIEEDDEDDEDKLVVEEEIFEINDSNPLDLRVSGISKKQTIEKRFSNEEAVIIPRTRLYPINEDIRREKYEYVHSSVENYSKPLEWYESETRNENEIELTSNANHELKTFDRHFHPREQNLPRQNSLSSPVYTRIVSNHRDIYKNPYRTINNNIVPMPAAFVPSLQNVEHNKQYHDQYHVPSSSDYLMLSPSSTSIFSYGSNQSDAGDYLEPEDLSVKNKKKVLQPTDSSVNILKHSRRDYSEVTGCNDMYYQCRNCNKCYSTYGGLVKHQESNHHAKNELRSVSSTEVEYNPIPPSGSLEDLRVRKTLKSENTKIANSPRYQCKDCGKSYSTYSGLTKHQQFHCPAAEKNQVKKLFSCKNCEKVYVSLGALKMHIRTHTLPCKCPLCGKAFSRPWLLQGHIRTHTGEKPFSCQHCHRAFADRSNLRAHLQTHSEVKKYSCTSCTKTFSRMSLLGKHIQGGCPGVTSNYHHNGHHQLHLTESQEYQEGKQLVDSTTDSDIHQQRIVYEQNPNDRHDYGTMEPYYKEQNVGVY